MQRRCLQVFLLVTALFRYAGGQTQDIYILSTDVQKLAASNKIYETLGAQDKITLYVNTLTAIEVVARKRAELRNSNPSEEDYRFAASILCLLPWSPPKKPTDVSVMQKMRPTIVADAFVSA
jgi:hypothetical protein